MLSTVYSYIQVHRLSTGVFSQKICEVFHDASTRSDCGQLLTLCGAVSSHMYDQCGPVFSYV